MANGNFGGGDGTKSSPYMVEDYADLNSVRNNLTAHYVQVSDIDCAGEPLFLPIGAGSDLLSSSNFSGVYSGANHSIKKLRINTNHRNVALFSDTTSGTVKRVHLQDVSITGSLSSHVGGITCLGGSIESCSVSGNIYGFVASNASQVGGISASTANISNCSFSGNLSGDGPGANVGGIIGYGSGVNNCHSDGVFTGTNVGGIAGGNGGGGINNSWSSAIIVARRIGGGIIGSTTSSTAYKSVKNCFALMPRITQLNTSFTPDNFGDIHGSTNSRVPIVVDNCYSLDSMIFTQEAP